MHDIIKPRVTLSVVSHGQGGLVAGLLEDLTRCPDLAAIILTINIPEDEIPVPDSIRAIVRVVRNDSPLGFAANHNAAFGHCTTPYFAIVNPDIRFGQDPFPVLIEGLSAGGAALSAPAVINSAGELEDSVRVYPTLSGLLLKALGIDDGRIVYRLGDPPLRPDWVAGMFLLVSSDIFRSIGRFDPGFHLYYEDVDLCARLRRQGHDLFLFPAAPVIHDARRASRRKFRYLLWHLSSMLRYFAKHLGRLPNRDRGRQWLSW